MAEIEILVDGLDHPVEMRKYDEVARAAGLVLGLAADGRGRVVLCCPGDRSVSVWDGTDIRRISTGLRFPNFPAFAPEGTLYVSDSGEWKRDDGLLWRIDVDGSAEVLSTSVPLPRTVAPSLLTAGTCGSSSRMSRMSPASILPPGSARTSCGSTAPSLTASPSRATVGCS
jgi:hypothetical protein